MNTCELDLRDIKQNFDRDEVAVEGEQNQSKRRERKGRKERVEVREGRWKEAVMEETESRICK